MTANEAAKACMARIVHQKGGCLAEDADGCIQIEREFTEIISQVTPPMDDINKRLNESIAFMNEIRDIQDWRQDDSNRFSDLQAQAQAMQQARCPHCEVPLDGREHKDGCHYTFFRARLQQNQPSAYNHADLCNANPYREIAPPLVPVQPMPTPELLMRGTAPSFDTSGLSEQGRFPQEIEEPRPRGWWARWFL